MKKQGLKAFLNQWVLIQMLQKKPAETATFVEVPSKSSRSKETEIVNGEPNQPNSTGCKIC